METAVPSVNRNALEDEFLRNIIYLAESESSTELVRNIHLVNEDFDAISHATEAWSQLKRVNFALMKRIIPNRSTAVVTTIRNEGIGIIEWIAHHKAVGFDHIFIYTNDNTDLSDQILKILHEAGFITLIFNRFSRGILPQVKAYEHSIHFLRELRKYEWVAYLDADEYLIPNERYEFCIQRLIDDVKVRYSGELPKAICLNWFWFGSDGHIERPRGLVQESFRRGYAHSHVKSIVRLQNITTMWPIHIPDPNQGWCVNGLLEPVVMASVDSPPRYDCGQINHYFNKSFEEYALKISRNDLAGESFAEKSFSHFFDWDAQSHHLQYDPPPMLLDRTKIWIDKIERLDGMKTAIEGVEAMYRTRVNALLGGDPRTIHERVSLERSRA